MKHQHKAAAWVVARLSKVVLLGAQGNSQPTQPITEAEVIWHNEQLASARDHSRTIWGESSAVAQS